MPVDFVAELEKLDGLPGEYHGFYAEKDGKFRLRDDDPIVKAAASTINGLNGALKNARKEAEGHKSKAGDWKPFAEYGDNPTDIATAITAKIKELEETVAKNGKVDIEKVKASIAESYKGEITKRDGIVTSLKESLHKHLVVGAATASLAKLEGDVELALPHVLSRLRPVEDDGKYEVVVLDEHGEVAYSKTNPGGKMTVEEYVTEMSKSDRYKPLFKSQARSGGGTNPGGSRGNPGRTTGNPATMSANEKIAANLPRRA